VCVLHTEHQGNGEVIAMKVAWTYLLMVSSAGMAYGYDTATWGQLSGGSAAREKLAATSCGFKLYLPGDIRSDIARYSKSQPLAFARGLDEGMAFHTAKPKDEICKELRQADQRERANK
jgi:hypothetical protein